MTAKRWNFLKLFLKLKAFDEKQDNFSSSKYLLNFASDIRYKILSYPAIRF